jgi:tetratricopeptide (TPR) repeat protein
MMYVSWLSKFKDMKKLFCCFFLISCFPFFRMQAQTSQLDSLEIALKNNTDDTVKCRIFEEMVGILDHEEKDVMIDRYLNFTEACLSKYPVGILKRTLLLNYGLALGYLGFADEEKGNPNKAVERFKKCLQISEQINDEEGIAHACHNLGASYRNTGNVVKALEYFHRALSILEKQNNKLRIAGVLNSIAMIHDAQGDSAGAMSNFFRALKIREEIGDPVGMSNSYNGIGQMYLMHKHYETALEYFEKAYFLRKSANDPVGMGTALNNKANVYERQRKNDEALRVYLESLELFKKAKYIRGVVPALINLSILYHRTGKNKEAEPMALQALDAATEIRSPQYIKTAAYSLSKIYKATNNSKKALENYELYIKMRDSLNNETTRKASIKSQLKYEYEKQAAADSVAHAKENEIKSAELSRQSAELKAKKNQQYALFGGLGLVIIFAGFMYNRFKVTQKQKTLIEQQKEIVEEQKKLVDEKQKEILDSIRYAKRIQLAQIPSEKAVEKNLYRLTSKVKS